MLRLWESRVSLSTILFQRPWIVKQAVALACRWMLTLTGWYTWQNLSELSFQPLWYFICYLLRAFILLSLICVLFLRHILDIYLVYLRSRICQLHYLKLNRSLKLSQGILEHTFPGLTSSFFKSSDGNSRRHHRLKTTKVNQEPICCPGQPFGTQPFADVSAVRSICQMDEICKVRKYFNLLSMCAFGKFEASSLLIKFGERD